MATELAYEDFKALRDKGLSVEQIASLEAGGVKPHTADWRAHLLAMLPAAGATAGGIMGGLAGAPAGGVGAVPGAIVGGGVGAASGRVLENAGRKAMGLPSNTGLVERMSGGRVPRVLSEPLDTLEQGLMGGALEGAGTAAFGIPGRMAGGIERGLRGFADQSEGKFVSQALDKVRSVRSVRDAPVSPDVAAQEAVRVKRAMTAAGDIGPEVEAARESAGAARRAAGESKGKIIKESVQPGNEMTMAEVVDDVANALKGSMGTAPEKKRLLTMVRNRIKEVVSAHSLGALKGNGLVFDMEEADRIKRIFGQLNTAKGSFEGGKKGLTPKPVLDALIHGAYKRGVEKRIPIIEDVNRGVQSTIRQHQSVSKMSESAQQPIVQSLRQGRGERIAAEGARIGAERGAAQRVLSDAEEDRVAETMARMEFNKPMFQPHFTMHGMSFPSVKAGPAARGTANVLGNRAVSGTGRYGGDALNALLRLLTAQENPEEAIE